MSRSLSAAWPLRHVLGLAVIVAVALGVRLYYVYTAVVDHPLRGDAVQYFIYALNLLDHHTFSGATQGFPAPDSFRDPGYPLLLSWLSLATGRAQTFYITTLTVQCVLGAATVGIYTALARRWLGVAAAAIVGAAMALWPQAITLTGYVLSETLLGFLVASALALLQHSCDRRSVRVAAAAGLLFAFAALTNAMLLPFAAIMAVMGAWRDRRLRALWVVLLLTTTAPCLAWIVRGALLPAETSSGDRAIMNVVQGSWPEYHDAWASAILNDDALSKSIMASIDAEYQLMHRDRLAGLGALSSRMSQRPLHYLEWYTSKPIELWGWGIGIGQGDIYVFPTFNSPLSSRGVLRWTTDAMFLLNPLLMLAAAVGAVVILAGYRRRPRGLVAATLCALFITLVCTILQADARYSVPYRGIEWVLAAAGVAAFGDTLRRLRRGPLYAKMGDIAP